MLLGIKTKQDILKRHALMATFVVALLYFFWSMRMDWTPDMRLWRAFGDTAFVLLWVTLILGPVSNLWEQVVRFVPWRREFGIWFAVVGLVHGYLVWDGWARWSVWRFLGYEFLPQAEKYIRVEPGFGLANLMGLMALVFSIILAATSFDRAVSFLGISSWKWLHGFSYVIYYIIILHAGYFLFIHYTPSLLNTSVPDPNWFRYYFLTMSVLVPLAQGISFVKVVHRRRKFGK